MSPTDFPLLIPLITAGLSFAETALQLTMMLLKRRHQPMD